MFAAMISTRRKVQAVICLEGRHAYHHRQLQLDHGSSDILRSKSSEPQRFISALIQAFRYNLYGSRHQWIIVGYYEPDWWLANPGPCNTSEILQALNGTLQTRVAHLGYDDNARTVADLVRLLPAGGIRQRSVGLFRHRRSSSSICLA